MSSYIKQVATIRRRSSMTRCEFLDYHFQVHGALSTAPILEESPAIYYQTHFFDSAYQSTSLAEPAYFGHDDMAELYYHDLDHVGKVFSSEYVKMKVGPDSANFNDMSSGLFMFSKEETIFGTDTLGQDAANRVDLVAKYHLQGTGVPDDATLLAADIRADFINAFKGCATRIVVNIRVTDKLDVLKYFGVQLAPPMSLVYTVYLKDQDLKPFRQAQKDFEDTVGGKIVNEVSFVCFGKRALVFDHTRGIGFDASRQPVLSQ